MDRDRGVDSIAAKSGSKSYSYLLIAESTTKSMLEVANAITFTDKDIEVQYPDHCRPLYMTAQINDVFVRRALVDT